jgi:sec-independent protein translocase protein TatB
VRRTAPVLAPVAAVVQTSHVFDINGFELLIILVLAVILIGPDRLPEYVSGLRSVVKRVRSFIEEGRTALRDEFGDDVDWSQYDPRQYDPRRIVREALMEDDELSASPRRRRRASSGSTPSVAVPVAVASVASGEDPDATPMLGTPALPTTDSGTGTPYDPEST